MQFEIYEKLQRKKTNSNVIQNEKFKTFNCHIVLISILSITLETILKKYCGLYV